MEQFEDRRMLSVNISGSSSVNEGAAYTLCLAATDMPGTLASWDIAWGDGTTSSAGPDATAVDHVFADGDAIFSITASAIDDTGAYSADPLSVNVMNVAPTLGISGSSNAVAGQTYTLSFSSSDPGQDTISGWSVNWGDGTGTESINGNPGSASHTFGPGNYTITASATDEDGTYSAGTGQLVQVATAPPTLGISGDPSIAEGNSYVLGFSVVASTNPVTGLTVNWGDGTSSNVDPAATSSSHIYGGGGGNFSISVTATDQYGNYSSDPLGITVIPASDGANALYQADVDAADAAYLTAISDAKTTYGSDLAAAITNYSAAGNAALATLSSRYDSIAQNYSQALVGVADDILSSVADLAASDDLSMDAGAQVFSQAIDDAMAAYNSTVDAAYASYLVSANAAQQTYQQAYDADYAGYQAALGDAGDDPDLIAAATSAFQAQVATAYAAWTATEGAAWADYNAAEQQAYQACINAALDALAAWQNVEGSSEAGWGQVLDGFVGIMNDALAVVESAIDNDFDAADSEFDSDLAVAEDAFDSALSAAQTSFDSSKQQAYESRSAAEGVVWANLQNTLSVYNELAYAPTRRNMDPFNPQDIQSDLDAMRNITEQQRQEIRRRVRRQQYLDRMIEEIKPALEKDKADSIKRLNDDINNQLEKDNKKLNDSIDEGFQKINEANKPRLTPGNP